MEIGWVLPALWAGLGIVIVTCSLRAARSRRAYVTGVTAVSLLWVVAGAGANASLLARGGDYSGFADGASTSFVHETWESLVVPHHGLFIGLLIAFEATAGVLVLVEGAPRQFALVLLIGFTVALVSFGWGFLVWSIPMVAALSLLWRAGRAAHGPANQRRTTTPPASGCSAMSAAAERVRGHAPVHFFVDLGGRAAT